MENMSHSRSAYIEAINNLDNVSIQTLDSLLEYERYDSIFEKDEEEFYRLLAKEISELTIKHPNWGIVSGRLLIKALKLKAPKTFSDFIEICRNRFNQEYYEFIMDNKDILNAMIIPERDNNFAGFGVSTLIKSYLSYIKDKKTKKEIRVETPQYLFLRCAIQTWMPNLDKIREMYDDLSLGRYSHASPTLMNSCHKRNNLASCFLMKIGDDMRSIAKGWHDSAIISMNCGGLGIYYGDLRHSEIGEIGMSTGLVPWLKIKNQILNSVDQGGKRKGSGTIQIGTWHIDIFEFLDLRKNTGSESMRARDLFYGLLIDDVFMERVIADKDYSLFCPHKAPKLSEVYGKEFKELYEKYEKDFEQNYKGELFYRKIRARDLYFQIKISQIKTGMPFTMYKDSMNEKCNQKNLGMIITNLCVSGNTMILTRNGHIAIEELEGEDIDIWNGEEWSNVKIIKTGEHQDLVRVNLSNETYIDCTPYHKFYLQTGYGKYKTTKVEAKDLRNGDKLMKWNLPSYIDWEGEEFKYPYTHGFFCGDGTTYDNYDKTERRGKIALYGEKKNLLEYFEYRSHSKEPENESRPVFIYLHHDIAPKFEVPLKADAETRIKWFEGYCDADGCIARNGTNESIQITSIHKEFLLEVRLMLQTLGVEAKIIKGYEARKTMMPDGKGGMKEYDCKETYRLLVNSNDLFHLSELGFSPRRLKFEERKPQRSASQFIKVESVEESLKDVNTYCFTEHKRNAGMFNGILTGQCQEITEHVSEKEIASCNLGAVCLNSCVNIEKEPYFDFDKLELLTRNLVRNLNNIIDRNYYPDDIPEIKYSNLKNRPLGIGVQGFADCLALLDIPFVNTDNSQEYDLNEPFKNVRLNRKAKKLNNEIFETMYYSAVSESIEMAKEKGKPYDSYEGSPASQGILQYDLWNIEGKHTPYNYEFRYNKKQWDSLKNDLKKYGMYNSLLIALMPTASTAQILGNNEAFEPYTENIYARTTLSGQFIIINRHLVKDFSELGLWNTDIIQSIIQKNGSIQHIQSPSNFTDEQQKRFLFLKDKFRTVYEIPQKALMEMSLDRGRFICQTQSFNCFMKDPTPDKLLSYDYYAWKGGAKTGMYYLRSSSSNDAVKFSSKTEKKKNSRFKKEGYICKDDVCISCIV